MSDSTKLTGAAKVKAEARAAREAAEREAEAKRLAAELAAENAAQPNAAPAAPVVPVADEVPANVVSIATSVVATIAPAQAAEQAEIARHNAAHSGDAQQAELESEIAKQLVVKARQHKADLELAARRRRASGPAPTHKPDHVPAEGGSIPHTIQRFSWVMFKTAPNIPDQPALVLRRHPEAEDGQRYFADLYVFPTIPGSDATTKEAVTYGRGEGQFFEPAENEDDWGLNKPFEAVKSWRHE